MKFAVTPLVFTHLSLSEHFMRPADCDDCNFIVVICCLCVLLVWMFHFVCCIYVCCVLWRLQLWPQRVERFWQSSANITLRFARCGHSRSGCTRLEKNFRSQLQWLQSAGHMNAWVRGSTGYGLRWFSPTMGVRGTDSRTGIYGNEQEQTASTKSYGQGKFEEQLDCREQTNDCAEKCLLKRIDV